MPGAAGRGLPRRGDQERPDELRGFLAEGAFGQPSQAQPAVVEHAAHGEGGRAGGDGLAGETPEQERPQLVHQRPDRMSAAGVGQLLIPGPEPGQHRVPHPRRQPVAVGVSGEQRGDISEGDLPGAGRDGLQQGQARGAEDVVGPGSPELAEDAAEDAGDVVDDYVVVGAGPVALQHVQARRRRPVGGVEQHHLARHLLREAGEQVGDRVALGVDEHHPAARLRRRRGSGR